MPKIFPLAAPTQALAVLLLCLTATRGLAQVDQRALDQLGPPPGGAAPAHAAKPAAPPAHPATRSQPTALHPNGPHQSLPPLRPRPPPPVVPAAAPPLPVLPPPIAVPTRLPPPPIPPTITGSAPDTTSKLANGLRVSFGADRSDLNPDAAAAIVTLAHAAPPGPDTTFAVTAYAAGSPDDPSTPRRLSLSRALGVRSLLMEQGIESKRIYVKALGASGAAIAQGPPDRVDITVVAPPPPAPAAPSQKAAP